MPFANRHNEINIVWQTFALPGRTGYVLQISGNFHSERKQELHIFPLHANRMLFTLRIGHFSKPQIIRQISIFLRFL